MAQVIRAQMKSTLGKNSTLMLNFLKPQTQTLNPKTPTQKLKPPLLNLNPPY